MMRIILQSFLGLILVLAILYSFNLAAFNFWAAGGPPTPNPEVYRFRGIVFLSIAFLLTIFSVFLFFWSRKKKK